MAVIRTNRPGRPAPDAFPITESAARALLAAGGDVYHDPSTGFWAPREVASTSMLAGQVLESRGRRAAVKVFQERGFETGEPEPVPRGHLSPFAVERNAAIVGRGSWAPAEAAPRPAPREAAPRPAPREAAPSSPVRDFSPLEDARAFHPHESLIAADPTTNLPLSGTLPSTAPAPPEPGAGLGPARGLIETATFRLAQVGDFLGRALFGFAGVPGTEAIVESPTGPLFTPAPGEEE